MNKTCGNNAFCAVKILAAIFVVSLSALVWQINCGAKGLVFLYCTLLFALISLFMLGYNAAIASNKKNEAQSSTNACQKTKPEGQCLRLQYALMLISPNKPLGQKLKLALKMLSEVLPDKIFAFFLPDEGGLRCAAVSWLNEQMQTGAVAEQEYIAEELLAKIKGCIDIRRLKELYYFDKPLAFTNGKGGKKGILAPVLLHGRCMGIVAALSIKSSSFSDDEKFILKCFCPCAALLVDNALLFSSFENAKYAAAESRLASSLFAGLSSSESASIAGWEAAQRVGYTAEHSGDFHFFIKLSQDKMVLIAGHTSDKGLKSAFFINNLSLIINCLIQAYKGPAQLLNALSAQIGANTKTDIFASIIAAEINTSSREITVSNAGFTSPLINRPKSGFAELEQGELGVPLGLLQGPEAYSNRVIKLLPGDGILIYSEGALEYVKPEKGIAPNEELKLILDKIPTETSPELLLEAVAESLSLKKEQQFLREDYTLIYLKSED